MNQIAAMSRLTRIRSAAGACALAVALAPAALAAQDDRVTEAAFQSSALGALASAIGEAPALALATAAVDDTATLARGALLVEQAALELEAQGDTAGAARLFEIASDLAERAGAAESLAAGESGLPSVDAWFRAAAFAQAAAVRWRDLGDSIRWGRSLRRAGRLRMSLDLVAGAWPLLQGADAEDRAHTLLVMEEVLRLQDEHPRADTLLMAACSWGCGVGGHESDRLVAELEVEARTSPTPESSFEGMRGVVRDLVWDQLDSYSESHLPLRVRGISAKHALTDAVERARLSGTPTRLATLLHALGTHLKPRARVSPSFYEDAVAALGEAARIRREVGDTAGAVSSLGMLAMVHLGSGAGWEGLLPEPPAVLETALAVMDTADALAESTPDAEQYRAMLRRRRAQIEIAAGNVRQGERLLAEATAARAPEQSLLLSNDHYWVARQLLGSGRPERALEHAHRAYAALPAAGVEPALHARTASAIAQSHAAGGRPDSAAHWFGTAANVWLGVSRPIRAAHALNAASESWFEAGRLERARTALDSAVAVARQRTTVVRPWDLLGDGLAARIANNRGLLLLAEERWDPAGEWFAAARSSAPVGHSEALEAERNQVLAALARSEAPAADSVLQALRWAEVPWRADPALEPARPASRPLTRGWSNVLEAGIHARRGALGEILARLDTALPLLRQTDHEPSLRRALAVRGWLFSALGRPDSARVYLQQAGAVGEEVVAELSAAYAESPMALRARVAAMEPRDVPPLIERMLADARRNRDHLSEALVLEARAWHHLRRATPPDPAAAAEWYDSAAIALGRVDQTGLSDWFRIQLREQFARLQRESALAWLARSDELGAEEAAAGALAAADRGRARALQFLVSSRNPSGTSYLGGIWSNREYSDQTMPEVGRDLLTLQSWSYGRESLTLAYLQAGDTLITWLHGPDPDATDAEERYRGRLRVTRQAVPADTLSALIARARIAMGVDSAGNRGLRDMEEEDPLSALLLASEAPPTRAALAELAAVLLPAELRQAVPDTADLLIVPQGPLAAVPFTALPIDDRGVPLSSAYSVRYSPSLSATRSGGALQDPTRTLPVVYGHGVERDSLQAVRQAWLERAVVVGSPTMPTVRNAAGRPVRLAPLPGAEQEARAVAERLGTRPILGDAATLSSLRPRLADATILHLATHGYAFADEQRVDESFIALAPGEEDDGVVTVEELLEDPGLRLPSADLVVLSACQTGLGQITDSEGTLGLQRAFLGLGAGSLLVSLWSVSDQATSLLLRSFYQHWLGDDDAPSKQEALRRAQEDLRTVRAYSHPRFWAAFQLIGAP